MSHNRSEKYDYDEEEDVRLRKVVLSKRSILFIANLVSEKYLKRKLTKSEVSGLTDFLVHKTNYRQLNAKFNKIQDVLSFLAEKFYKNLKLETEEVDIHEILKKEIKNNGPKTVWEKPGAKIPGVEPFTGSINTQNVTEPSLVDMTKIINRESVWRDSHIIIDSRYRDLSNPGTDEIRFNITTNTREKTAGTGVVTALGNIRNIWEIKILPFSIPYVPSADNFYKLLTMTIKEFTSQSFEAYEDSQFHFMFKTAITGNLIELTPKNDTFRFRKAITRIDDFTLRFGSPYSNVTFDADRQDASLVTFNNPLEINFLTNHNLITGDLVVITGFSTLNLAADDAIIQEVNRSEGHIVTVTSATQITINVDGTSVVAPDATNVPNVYFGSKRMFIPMIIKYEYSQTAQD